MACSGYTMRSRIHLLYGVFFVVVKITQPQHVLSPFPVEAFVHAHCVLLFPRVTELPVYVVCRPGGDLVQLTE